MDITLYALVKKLFSKNKDTDTKVEVIDDKTSKLITKTETLESDLKNKTAKLIELEDKINNLQEPVVNNYSFPENTYFEFTADKDVLAAWPFTPGLTFSVLHDLLKERKWANVVFRFGSEQQDQYFCEAKEIQWNNQSDQIVFCFQLTTHDYIATWNGVKNEITLQRIN